MNKLDELEALLSRVLPIRTHDTADYAELCFGEHRTQAMTMDPATWNGIGEGLPTLIALARQSAEQAARVVELEAALRACVDEMTHCGGDGYWHDSAGALHAARDAYNAALAAQEKEQDR
jgi:hypothetical protein